MPMEMWHCQRDPYVVYPGLPLLSPALHKSTWELHEMAYISAQYRAIVMLHRNSLLVGSRSRPLKNGAFQKNWNCNLLILQFSKFAAMRNSKVLDQASISPQIPCIGAFPWVLSEFLCNIRVIHGALSWLSEIRSRMRSLSASSIGFDSGSPARLRVSSGSFSRSKRR